MESTLRVVKYIKQDLGQRIILSSKKYNIITAFDDADWDACPLTVKYISSLMKIIIKKPQYLEVLSNLNIEA